MQVTYLMGEQSTRDGEFGLLEKIRDNHPKYAISATPFLTSRDGNQAYFLEGIPEQGTVKQYNLLHIGKRPARLQPA